MTMTMTWLLFSSWFVCYLLFSTTPATVVYATNLAGRVSTPASTARPTPRPGNTSPPNMAGVPLNCNYTSPGDSFDCKYRRLLTKVLTALIQLGNSRNHARFAMSVYRAQNGQVCKIMSTTPACVTSMDHFVMLTRTPTYVNEYENIKNAYQKSQVPVTRVCSSYTGSQTASILSFDLVAGTCPTWNGRLVTDSPSGSFNNSPVCTSPAIETCGSSFQNL